ncbi:AraC family transcriptional regulator [Cecembia rubra]|uniref:AraC family transcriptional regulator n=2 Tax=Cecembia rubra TaxID=1485585 RepID=A0A2P8DWV2_9BACT|nr:AraC family transcriptional regulator [Cecembia rubra]
MQPLHFKVPRLKDETIRVECWELDNFFEPIHYHEEFQITLIQEGDGSLFVAESIVDFKKDDVYLFGKNLPHVFRNNEYFLQNGINKRAKAISVFFNQDVLKSSLSDIPESYNLQKLLDYSVYGIKVSESRKTLICEKLKELTKKNAFEKYLGLLDILECVSSDTKLNFISSLGVPIKSVQENLPKINLVFDYVRNNYTEKITLEQIAEMVNMSPTAFCRYFKYKSQKTFSRFLIEVRIANACRLMLQNDFNTAESCYNSGYNNLSNFHKHFKSITGMTPLEFKSKILNKEIKHLEKMV